MMKKILALCLALLLAMSAALATPAADEAYDLVALANEMISAIYPDEGQLFVYADEMEDGLISFSTEDGDIAICAIPGAAGEHVDIMMLVCSNQDKARLAMNTICALPFAYDDVDGAVLVAAWFDDLFDDVLAAMESGEVFMTSFEDAATFRAELVVVPTDVGNRLNIFFYATGESDGSGAA